MPEAAASPRPGRLAFRFSAIAFSLLIGLPSAKAENDPPKFARPLAPTQRVFIDNTNLSANEFLAAYVSNSVEERRYAELYLLGVLDSTEGISWCDYKRFKTITLGEEIFQGLKGLDGSRRNARAAHVITRILGDKFPCQRSKK